LDFAGDVLAGVRFLQQQPEVDPERIGLVGHSEGAIIAAIAAARDADVAFIVLLAGPGVSGRELMPWQLAAITRAAGRSEDEIKRQLQAQARVHELLIEGADEQAIRDAVGQLVDAQLESLGEQQRQQMDREAVIDAGVRQVTSNWYRTFLVTDPAQWLRQVRCPVLALGGSLDLQVPADRDLPAIQAAVREGGNERVTVREMPGLNHLFQHASTGSPAEYGQIQETFSPQALTILSEWIRAQIALD